MVRALSQFFCQLSRWEQPAQSWQRAPTAFQRLIQAWKGSGVSLLYPRSPPPSSPSRILNTISGQKYTPLHFPYHFLFPFPESTYSLFSFSASFFPSKVDNLKFLGITMDLLRVQFSLWFQALGWDIWGWNFEKLRFGEGGGATSAGYNTRESTLQSNHVISGDLQVWRLLEKAKKKRRRPWWGQYKDNSENITFSLLSSVNPCLSPDCYS